MLEGQSKAASALEPEHKENLLPSQKTVLPRKVHVGYNTPALFDFRLMPGGYLAIEPAVQGASD